MVLTLTKAAPERMPTYNRPSSRAGSGPLARALRGTVKESSPQLASITRPSHRSRGKENEGLDGCYTKSGSP